MISRKLSIAFVSAVTSVAALAACAPDAVKSSDSPAGHTQSQNATTAASASSPAVIAPQKDYVANMVRCLTERGWNVVASDDGSYETPDGIPNEQLDQYKTDVTACRASFGYDKIAAPHVTREQAQKLYNDLLKVAQCVRGQGYTVPDPPSEQTFVEALVNYPIPVWHPYQVVTEQGGPDALKNIEKTCPVPKIN